MVSEVSETPSVAPSVMGEGELASVVSGEEVWVEGEGEFPFFFLPFGFRLAFLGALVGAMVVSEEAPSVTDGGELSPSSGFAEGEVPSSVGLTVVVFLKIL